MTYIPDSANLVGYRVRVERRDAFRIYGFPLIAPAGAEGEAAIDALWRDVAADGRLERLVRASSVRPWILGLASWDPECERNGQRYDFWITVTESKTPRRRTDAS